MSAISVQNIGKQYLIRHAAAPAGYATFREAVMQRLGGLFKRSEAGPKRGSKETFWALREIDFEIPVGSVTGIIGRNGAGKSTLLKLLSRITEPTTGRIELEGRVSSLLEVGTGFHPELSGRENIFLNGSILGMNRREIRSKLDEIVAFAQIERFLDTPVKRYSSGMYVRLAFAIAAHLETEILLVDEVLAVGDAEFQKKCLGKMNTIAQSGRTVLFVSHNMATMKRLCERGIYLKDGRLELDTDINTCVTRYLSDVGGEAGECATFEREPFEREDLPHGGARIRSVRLLDEAGKPAGQVSLGATLTIEITVAYASSHEAYWHSLQIRNSDGQNLYNIYDFDTREVPLEPARERVLRVQIPDWCLVADRYDVTVWVGNAHRSTVDSVENAVAFESLSIHPQLRRTLKPKQELLWQPLEWNYFSKD